MVKPETTEMIDKVVQDLASRSGLPPPVWDYFVPRDAREGNILGVYNRLTDKISLNQTYIEEVEDNPAQVVRTVAHEYRHYWQDQTGFTPNPNTREEDARRYDKDYLGYLTGFPDTPTRSIHPRRCGWLQDQLIRDAVPAEVLTLGIVPKIGTGRWIRYHLTKEVDEDYGLQMWKVFEALKKDAGQKSSTYKSFQRYIWVLKELELVEISRTEAGENNLNQERHYYRVRPGGIEDPAWEDPQGALLPKD